MALRPAVGVWGRSLPPVARRPGVAPHGPPQTRADRSAPVRGLPGLLLERPAAATAQGAGGRPEMPRVVFEKRAARQRLAGRAPPTDGRELRRVRRTAPERDAARLLARRNLTLPPPPPPRISPPKANGIAADGVATLAPARVQTPAQSPPPICPPPQ